MEVLLVAVNGHRYLTVLQFMRFVPSHERLESEAEQTSAFSTYPGSTVAVDWHGIYGSAACFQWSRLFTSRDGLFHFGGTSDTYDDMGYH